jgi:hypothetical protein
LELGNQSRRRRDQERLTNKPKPKKEPKKALTGTVSQTQETLRKQPGEKLGLTMMEGPKPKTKLWEREMQKLAGK